MTDWPLTRAYLPRFPVVRIHEKDTATTVICGVGCTVDWPLMATVDLLPPAFPEYGVHRRHWVDTHRDRPSRSPQRRVLMNRRLAIDIKF